MTASRFGPTAAVVAAVLASCSAACSTPSVAPTASPAASEAQASGTPTAAVPDCADVFDAAAGKVAFTIGDGHANGLARINADGSDFQPLLGAVDIPGQPTGGTEAPRWLPDNRILFDTNRYGGPDDFHVYVMSADGGDPTQLTGGADGIENYPMLSPDGSTLVYGKYLATPEGPDPWGATGALFLSDPDGSNERQLTIAPEGAIDEWPDISPDGQWVAFTRGLVQAGGLYIINIDGSGLRQIIGSDFEPLRPRWSPDGQLIVVHSNWHRFETESANVWVVAPDGTGLRQLTHESVPGQAWAPDWSPDGEHIIFVHTPRSGDGVYLDVIGLDGSSTCRLYQGGSQATGWDPDWGPPGAP
jgi:Tol biopolymer transport system component